MDRASKTSMGGSSTNRKPSQPVYNYPQVMAPNRRGSEMGGIPRVDPLPPSNFVGGMPRVEPFPPSTSQYDDKVAVMEAKGPRKSRVKDGVDGKPLDADKYNCDGTLRTVYCMPDFDHSYDQARKAHYIRSPEIPDDQKSLSIRQIFGREDS